MVRVNDAVVDARGQGIRSYETRHERTLKAPQSAYTSTSRTDARRDSERRSA